MALAPLVACASSQRSIGYESVRVPGVQVIARDVAARVGGRSLEVRETLVGRYGKVEAVNALLATAWRRKARYISDLQLVSYSRLGDRTRECRTRLRPVKETYETTEVVTTPARHERRAVLRPTTRTVSESRYQCKNVPHTEVRREPYTTQSCGYSGFGSSRSYSCRTVTNYRSVARSTTRRQCSFVPRSRTVTSNEYTYESRYVPPRTQTISSSHSRWQLLEAKPSCKTLGDTPPAANYIAGRVHWPTPE